MVDFKQRICEIHHRSRFQTKINFLTKGDPMTKAELIDNVCKSMYHRNLSKIMINELCENLFLNIEKGLKKDKRFVYPGFGTWTVKRRNARTAQAKIRSGPDNIESRRLFLLSLLYRQQRLPYSPILFARACCDGCCIQEASQNLLHKQIRLRLAESRQQRNDCP